jgi:hypothetical protein
LLATRWREDEQRRIATITTDPDPVHQALLLREELLSVIDAKVALEHDMEMLRHQLLHATERADEVGSHVTGVRTVLDPATELSGRPAPILEVVAPDAGDMALGD